MSQNDSWDTFSAPQSFRRMVTFDNPAHGNEALTTRGLEYPGRVELQHHMDEILDLLEANPTQNREANERKRHWKHWRNIQCCRIEEIGFLGVDNRVWNLFCQLACHSVWVSYISAVRFEDWKLWPIPFNVYWRNHLPLQPQRHSRKEVPDGDGTVFTREEQEREWRTAADWYCLYLSEW